MSKKPIVLCIMDGFGLRSEKHGNAILAANKPNLDYLFANYPNTILEASGEYVDVVYVEEVGSQVVRRVLLSELEEKLKEKIYE